MLLANSDEEISSEALRCMLCYKKTWHLEVSDRLLRLTDNKEYKDAMLNWDIRSHLDDMSDPNDVLELSADICRVSYGKLMFRKGRSSKDGLKTRRAGK